MAMDKYKFDFKYLVETDFSNYLSELEMSMQQPVTVEFF